MKAKTELCRNLVGKHVVLTCEVATVGGSVFPEGTCFKIRQTHRGRFTLSGPAGSVSQVSRSKFRTVEIPACGFVENPDGSIVWGSQGEPERPDVVCVVYHLEDCGAWIPFSVWTRDEPFDVCASCCKRQDGDSPSHYSGCKRKGKIVTRRPIDQHDCDWIAREKALYHHESGGGGGNPRVGSRVESGPPARRIWIAEGEVVDGTDYVDGASINIPSLTDEQLAAAGYKRVHGPTPDPFADGIEGDTFHDERTGERYPDDDGEWCSFCTEQFVEQFHDLEAVGEYDADDDEVAGLYKPAKYPWDRVWVAPLPHGTSERSDLHICPKCAAQAVADHKLRGLVDTWSADPEAMPDPHREALLDAVRERAEPWIAGYEEMRHDKVGEWFGKQLASRLRLRLAEAQALCEEAGYR